jgi:hypothetical protein
VGLPRQIPAPGSGQPGHGPFGEKAFKGALIACAIVIAAGAAMLALGGDTVRGVGIALIVVCAVGLLTVGAGLVAERLLHRTPPRS